MADWSYWMIAAVLLVVAELFTGTVYLLVLAASLAGAGLAVWLFGTGTGGAFLLASLLSAAGTAAVYRLRPNRKDAEAIIANDLDIGALVQIESPLGQDLWRVSYRGTLWEARSIRPVKFETGGSARICGKDGITLLIEQAA